MKTECLYASTEMEKKGVNKHTLFDTTRHLECSQINHGHFELSGGLTDISPGRYSRQK